ncbi:hypothetical protein E5675_07390 [Sphingopyxis sp. PAMC25046]|uniref:hypothetical protein n=1 Tax=Sphingopyxis sp. PAMC25046 TaxID=2565556 RepID=UPI00109DE871|nr:hypothetical protein [Sphingopyxis sp. PAMC25046]QCB54274.1 hypothetical protein E5675_07390 [Sphingopyxis sp. PAMC25046]
MIDLEAINLNAAKAHFALANVPMYIARKLREDPAILNIALHNDADALFAEFVNRVSSEPASLREQVYPFALAVAAALKQDTPALKQMATLDLHHFGWLSDMISGLIEQQPSAATEARIGLDRQMNTDDIDLLASDFAIIPAAVTRAKVA